MSDKPHAPAGSGTYQEVHTTHQGDRLLRRRARHSGIFRTIRKVALKFIGRLHRA